MDSLSDEDLENLPPTASIDAAEDEIDEDAAPSWIIELDSKDKEVGSGRRVEDDIEESPPAPISGFEVEPQRGGDEVEVEVDASEAAPSTTSFPTLYSRGAAADAAADAGAGAGAGATVRWRS